MLVGIIGLALLLIVLRSGNTMTSSASSLELMFRNFLEKYLVARPRTKELIAFPILFLVPCLAKFKNKEFDILVSTTVVEVGVDVPNASVIVIENAERFGLSQLHQLRGRVGRGEVQSYCVLTSTSRSSETLARLDIMTKTNDGFIIAEKDLQIRGPGEFLGTRQSGLPDMIIGDIVNDSKILELARSEALYFVKNYDINDFPVLKSAQSLNSSDDYFNTSC